MEPTDTSLLVRRAKDGDRSACAGLVAATERMVYGVARRILHDPNDALDALQNAYLRAFRRLGELEDPERFAGWLRRIAVSAAWDVRRSRRRTFLDIAEVPDVAVLDEAETRWTRRQRESMAAAVLTLSDEERLLCDRHYHGGWDVARLAAEHGVTEAAMRKRLQRLRDKLRKEVEMIEKKATRGERLPKDLPAGIAELLARPRLTDLPENPVGRVARELHAQFPGYREIALPEIVDLSQMQAILGKDPVYVPQRSLWKIDADRILRFDLTVPLLLSVRGRRAPMRLATWGKVYRNDGVSSTHLQVFHQLELLLVDRKEKADPYAFLGSIIRSIDALLPGSSVKVNPARYPICSQSWDIGVEVDGKYTELMGGGVYNAETVKALGADPKRFTGIGLAYGLERVAALRFGIDDLRKMESSRVES